MLRELQENTGKQFNEIRETIQEWNDKFHKEKTKKENQTEILELKNTMTEMNNSIERFNTRLNEAEERIGKLKHIIWKYSAGGEQKKKMKGNEESLWDL